MAEADCAILVGISRYKNPDIFGPLDGPHNDVERMRVWLLADGVPSQNIHVLVTAPALIDQAPDDLKELPATAWSPGSTHFSDIFNQIVFDADDKFVRRKGRLYLYFSGHGFSVAKDTAPRAALFAADASRNRTSNIAGSLYAEAVRQASLFQEVVLIMDCCRDLELNIPYTPPAINTVTDEGAEKVKMLMIYATPSGGKAQERPLDEADGKVVGLLTHGFLKTLSEAATDVAGRIPSVTLRGYLEGNWEGWFGKAKQPYLSTPQNGDIFFQSRRDLVDHVVTLGTEIADGAVLRLQSATMLASGKLLGNKITWVANNYAWKVDVPIEHDGNGDRCFQLRLQREPHVLGFPDMPHLNCTFTPGEEYAIPA